MYVCNPLILTVKLRIAGFLRKSPSVGKSSWPYTMYIWCREMWYVQDRTPRSYVGMAFASSPQDEWVVGEDTAWPSSGERLSLHTLQTHPPLPRNGEGSSNVLCSSWHKTCHTISLMLKFSQWIENWTFFHKLWVNQLFHESSFSCSVVMCGLSLQLSEYSTYTVRMTLLTMLPRSALLSSLLAFLLVTLPFLSHLLAPPLSQPPSRLQLWTTRLQLSLLSAWTLNSDQSHSLLVFSTNHVAWYVLQVYTLDVRNSSAVRQAVYNIISRKNTQPFIPHEFTQQVRNDTFTTHLALFCVRRDLGMRPQIKYEYNTWMFTWV